MTTDNVVVDDHRFGEWEGAFDGVGYGIGFLQMSSSSVNVFSSSFLDQQLIRSSVDDSDGEKNGNSTLLQEILTS